MNENGSTMSISEADPQDRIGLVAHLRRPAGRRGAGLSIVLAVLVAAGCSTESGGAGDARQAGRPGAPAGADSGRTDDQNARGSTGVAGSEAPSTGGLETDAAPADEGSSAADVLGAEWTAGDTSEQRAVDGAALLGAIRVARHDGFDRIVLDFGSDPVPSYRIRYVDRPVRQCGSGDAVELAGDGWLSITAEPANAHTEAGEATALPRHREPRLPVVLELRMICDFEAQVEVVAGVASPERYRSFVLKQPNRLVVDVQHGK